MNKDNFDELLLFANEWEIQGLRGECQQFADQYFSADQERGVLAERVLTVLQHRLELNEPTSDLEDLLSERLHLFACEIVANEELQKLVKSIGFVVFWRVLEKHEDSLVGKHINELLSFLCCCENKLSFPEFVPYVVTERTIGNLTRQNMSEIRRVPSMASLCFDWYDGRLSNNWYMQVILAVLLFASVCFVSYLFVSINGNKKRTEMLAHETQQKNRIIDDLQTSLTASVKKVETLDDEMKQKNKTIDDLQTHLRENQEKIWTQGGKLQYVLPIVAVIGIMVGTLYMYTLYLYGSSGCHLLRRTGHCSNGHTPITRPGTLFQPRGYPRSY